MKKFLVESSTDKKFEGQIFFANTQISKPVKLPFTTEEYNCTMFNGLIIKLIKDNKEIIASLRR